MPNVILHMREGWTADEKKAVLDVVHAALVEAFGIPENDRYQRISQYPAEDFEIPPGKSEKFVYVEIVVFPGRSLEAKRALYMSIAEGFTGIGLDPQDMMITLKQPPMENWGLRGGIPATDIDFGFKIDV
ncbi:MAG: tautomerase family protein [Desulfovibrio sp.]|nr:MAG: tautomerase family protein [Desulfovibrio sp.]